MTKQLLVPAIAFALVTLAPAARATDYWVATNGSMSAAGTEQAPFTLSKAASTAKAGDVVHLHGGTYSGTLSPQNSGTADAWIIFQAVEGELPILDGNASGGTGVGSSQAQYVRFIGIAARNFSSSGFGNGWTDSNCSTVSNGNLEFINCIADGNGINGIAFYCASGLLIEQSIVAHNGYQPPSWSSGVNLFHAMGGAAKNIVRQTVSFENIDISSHHSDGSGFILDQNSEGALFENNIGFRNGGSCIRLTNSSGAQLVNNTCYHDGLEPSDAQGAPPKPGEIYFSNQTTTMNLVFVNNLAAASGYGNDQTAIGGFAATGSNNYLVDANGATPFFVDPAADSPDFHLSSSASANIIDKGTSSNAPATDIGFDAKCIKKSTPDGATWWEYTVDYDYIASIGGVAACFNPGARSGTPDIGAYEYGAMPAGSAGSAGSGGSTGGHAGGTAVGGSSGSAGAGAVGQAGASSGGVANGGTASGASTMTSGGAGVPESPAQGDAGCGCRTSPARAPRSGSLLSLVAIGLFGLRRSRRAS